MKNEFKGTQGGFKVINAEMGALHIINDEKVPTYAALVGFDDEEGQANATLIAEAFNVVNETGLTPKQLAEQNKELLEALKEVSSEYWILCAGNSNDAVLYAKCKAAIKNAEQ